MGADLYLNSIFKQFMDRKETKARMAITSDPTGTMESGGGYLRNSYNHHDIMWAMGMSWDRVVGPMLNKKNRLPIKRARELAAMIEAVPLTKERLAEHYLKNIIGSNGENHPTSGGFARRMRAAGCEHRWPPIPDFEQFARQQQHKREELLSILRKSIELGEPLECSL
jgi:hypothetical protein